MKNLTDVWYRINAVTLIYVFVCLGNSDSRDEVLRTEIIFDIMDFNKAGRISHDEMVWIEY